MEKCAEGSVKRKGYTRKNTGTYVRSTCVKTTRRRQATPKRNGCSPGQVSRKSYVRRITSPVHTHGYLRKTKSGKTVRIFPKLKSVMVKSACIKDVGKPGKLPEGAPRIGPLRKGELKKFGYLYKLPDEKRHTALKKAVKSTGPLNVYRKLNAVTKLSRLAAPAASSVFKKDRNWIRKTYANSKGTLRAF